MFSLSVFKSRQILSAEKDHLSMRVLHLPADSNVSLVLKLVYFLEMHNKYKTAKKIWPRCESKFISNLSSILGSHFVRVCYNHTSLEHQCLFARNFYYITVYTSFWGDNFNFISWKEAKTVCNSVGGILPSILHREEINYLVEMETLLSTSTIFLGQSKNVSTLFHFANFYLAVRYLFQTENNTKILLFVCCCRCHKNGKTTILLPFNIGKDSQAQRTLKKCFMQSFNASREEKLQRPWMKCQHRV